jgi:hypothetical protein
MTLNLPLKRRPLARDHHQPLPPRPDPWRSPSQNIRRGKEGVLQVKSEDMFRIWEVFGAVISFGS